MEKKKYLTIWQAVLFVIIVTILTGAMEMFAFYLAGGIDEYKQLIFGYSPLPAIGCLVAYYFAVRYSDGEIPSIKIFPVAIWYYIPTLVVLLRLADDPFTNIFDYWGVIIKGGIRVTELFIPTGNTELNVRFFVTVVFGPIAEELVFRAFLQKRLSMRYSPMMAILISSLLFAAFHQTISNLFSVMLWSVLFGYMYHFTGSIIYTIILHAFGNLATFYTTSHYYPINSDEGITYLVVYTLAVAVFVYLMYRFHRHHAHKEIPITEV